MSDLELSYNQTETLFPKFIHFLPSAIDGDAIDIGANFGFYSILLASKFENVYAFEANFKNWEILKKMTNVSWNVECIQKAIANTDGPIDLIVGPNASVHTINPKIEHATLDDGDFPYDPNDTETVDGITLNTFCKDKKIAFIKCDIEGGEEVIFDEACAKEVLIKDSPVIALECHNFIDLKHVYNNFVSYGYNQFYWEKGKVDFLDDKFARHYLIGRDDAWLEQFFVRMPRSSTG